MPRSVAPISLDDFFASKGKKYYKGYAGIKNLFGLLKTDVDVILKENNISLPKRSEKLNNLQSLVIPFNSDWGEWSKSTFCNLKQIEISLIDLYRQKQDYSWIAKELGISYDVALTGVIKAIRKLKGAETIRAFQKWKDFKHLNLAQKEDFLTMPVEGLRHIFPRRIYTLLHFFGNNMKEILDNVSVKELHKYRNFGDKAENELRIILKNYDCIDLLKQSDI